MLNACVLLPFEWSMAFCPAAELMADDLFASLCLFSLSYCSLMSLLLVYLETRPKAVLPPLLTEPW